ncbi:MAG: site-specific integrase [Candidatus Hydrogenedentes bacterium]|nr:site-specific integrase [Candidatus Hydrogenedentota bacterium]
MASIQCRKGRDGSTSYRVQVRIKGFPMETATFHRKTDATQWAQQKEADMRAGRYRKTVEAKRHTFGEMIDRYVEDILPLKKQNSQKAQGPQLHWWKKQLGPNKLADVTPAMIAQCRDRLAKKQTRFRRTPAPATLARYLAVLSHCFTVAVKEWGWAEENPVRKVTKPKEPRGRVRFLSDDDRRKLLKACRESRNPCLYDVVVLALSTGMRRGEIMGLTWDCIDESRGMITLHDTKNGERRGVPLVGHALEAIRERSRTRRTDTPYVFPAPYRYGDDPKPIDIQSAWKVALKRATIKDFRFHDLRHSAASYLAMGGATLAEIAEVLGHKTLAMVKRYAHLSEAHTSKVVERMNAQIFEKETSGGEGNEDEQGRRDT